MFPRANAGLGDLMADLQAAAQLADATGTPGGVAGWFQARLTAFQALPSDVRTIDGQIRRGQAALQGAAATQGAVLALDTAAADLATISADYPTVQADVQRVMYVLAPLLPDIQRGAWNASMLSPLLGSGVDLLATFGEVNRLLALRDDANKQIQAAAHDGSLPLELRARLARALAATDTGVLTLALLGVGGWLLVRAFRRRGAR